MSVRDDTRWWRKDGDDIADTICQNTRRIRSNQDYRRQDYLAYASLYGDVQMLGFTPNSYAKPVETKRQPLSLNVVRTMVGACKARIAAKAKSKPTFVTRGADWSLSRRAKKLEKAIEGTFSQTRFWEKAMRAFVDGAVFGTGHIMWNVHYEARRVYCHRVLPGEWLIEDQEGLYGDESVRTAYLLRWYDPIVLAEAYPEFEEEIMNCRQSEEDMPEYEHESSRDRILVREAWRLPSWPGAKDGMWARCIPGKTLATRPYKRDYFPVASWCWEEALAGAYGVGLAHDLFGIQLEINDILDEITEACHGVKGKWAIEEMSRVNPNELTDESDAIVVYRGTAPIYITPQAIPRDLYDHLWMLYSKAFEVAGISQLAATSQKPAGLNSGEAQRVYRDNQSERFLDKFESWDRFVLQNARLAHDCLRDLNDYLKEQGEEGLKLSVRRGRFASDVLFPEIDLDDHVYELDITPTSMIPTTPSGKIAFAEDLTRIGFTDAEELVEIIQMPDTERLVERKLATRKLVEDIIDNMAETGEFEPPEPFMLWPVALRVAVESYLTFRREKAPPELLDMIARWIVLARMQMKKEQAEEAPAPAPPPPGPPGQEMVPAGPMPLPPGAPPPPLVPAAA